MEKFLIRLRYITIMLVFFVPIAALAIGMFLGLFAIPALASNVSHWFWLLFILYPVAATVVSVLFDSMDDFAQHGKWR